MLADPVRMLLIRERLVSPSWFMKCLNEEAVGFRPVLDRHQVQGAQGFGQSLMVYPRPKRLHPPAR
jgi:hypothetical protein